MYDLNARRTGSPPVPQIGPPSWLLTFAEAGRFGVELPASLVADVVLPGAQEGAGRPVLVLPGFGSPDLATVRGRRHLQRLGYRAYGWGLGRNHGLTDPILDGVVARLEEVHASSGEPVSVVGWSFGGVLARWLAHQRPSLVRQVACLGTPYRPEGEHTRTTPLFERSARTHGLSVRALEVMDRVRTPLPVPVSAIFSRTDGMVPWRGCLTLPGEQGEDIAVPSSHAGLLTNPLSLAVLDDRLAQDPEQWRPFDWLRCLQRLGGRREAA